MSDRLFHLPNRRAPVAGGTAPADHPSTDANAAAAAAALAATGHSNATANASNGISHSNGAAPPQQSPYASASKWRHQESSKYARHAAATAMGQPQSQSQTTHHAGLHKGEAISLKTSHANGVDGRTGVHGDVATVDAVGPETALGMPGASEDGTAAGTSASSPVDGKEIVCGPLLNYRRTEGSQWIGSVLVVTRGGGASQAEQAYVPSVLLQPAEADATTKEQGREIHGECLYSDPQNTFWRFDVDVPMGATGKAWQYRLPDSMRYASATKPRVNTFWVPALTEAMRILFFSCNGFSVGTDEDAWSGPALWNDVLRKHASRPFHVMIGGGDQIYNDSIRVHGPLRAWTAISSPHKRREYRFGEELRQACDDFYRANYLRWYATEPFATANGQVAQLNIWDDHDIIDGFGSYVHEFMKCDVFRGIGGLAHKYYMLFQHHLPPPPTTFTSDDPTGDRPLVDTYVAPPRIESSYIVGPKPGPYVEEHSHSMYCQLGARMAFLGIDARTERTRHQVNDPATYDRIFARLNEEFRAAAATGTPVRHLILLLGIPIAYPRLTWLENVFGSPVMGPIKFLNRRFGVGGGFINSFDGSVDLLDDLDDHYTARTHKRERNALVERLQQLSAEHSVRVTILGGDVHLAALGRFYANPALKVPAEQDCRFMVNVVSSAITNKPPPTAIANLLARRNRIHHLNSDTDETLFRLFNKDPGTSSRTAGHNQVTMPSRNFAVLTENAPNAIVEVDNGRVRVPQSAFKDGHYALHNGEVGAGTEHKAAAAATHGRSSDGGLDVCIHVEMDQHDREGRTEGYGLTVPALDCGPLPSPSVPRHRWGGSSSGSRPTTAGQSGGTV